jgi:hypothetical protein
MPPKNYPRHCDRCHKAIPAPRLNVCDGNVAKTIVAFTLDDRKYNISFRLGTGRGVLFHAEDDSDAMCFRCLRSLMTDALDVLEGDYQPKARAKAVA